MKCECQRERSVALASREGVALGDAGDGNRRAWDICSSDTSNEIDHIFEVACDVAGAAFTISQTESAALGSASRAGSPTDRADTLSSLLARRVAEARVILLISFARKGRASGAAIGFLGAGNANVCHAVRAVW